MVMLRWVATILGGLCWTVVLAGQLAGQPAGALPPEFRTVAFPPVVQVIPPGAAIPAELARFSGWWGGHWDGVLPHVLVVEEVVPERITEPAGATVVYAWGDAPQWRVRPGWIRVRGRFVRTELHLPRFTDGAQVIYRMRPDGTLDATYQWADGRIERARMRRLPVATPSPTPTPTP